MKLRTQLFPGYVLVLVLMIAMAGVANHGPTSLTDTADWVSHTHEVMGKGRLVQKIMVDVTPRLALGAAPTAWNER